MDGHRVALKSDTCARLELSYVYLAIDINDALSVVSNLDETLLLGHHLADLSYLGRALKQML